MSITRTSADGPQPPAKQSSDAHDAIARCLALGMTPASIAKSMHPEDKKARKAMRARIWYMIRNESSKMAASVKRQADLQMMMDLGPATKALGRRAKKGRPDAIKLLMEASGFHNTKVKHEHSGKVEINLNMPRPQMPKSEDDDDDAIDAEVVDD